MKSEKKKLGEISSLVPCTHMDRTFEGKVKDESSVSSLSFARRLMRYFGSFGSEVNELLPKSLFSKKPNSSLSVSFSPEKIK